MSNPEQIHMNTFTTELLCFLCTCVALTSLGGWIFDIAA